MPLTQQTYQSVALEDPERRWELHHGRLREKPGMTFRHNRVSIRLAHQLLNQLDLDQYDVRVDSARVRYSDETYYIPDLLVLPLSAAEPFWDSWQLLEAYGSPMPLIVEVWSPSTGDYDIETKIPEYMRRGDIEIWRLHPFELTLTIWRRQADGSYKETVVHSGSVEPVALPGVVIDIDSLFQ
jgi:Uma2 family endonuclease